MREAEFPENVSLEREYLANTPETEENVGAVSIFGISQRPPALTLPDPPPIILEDADPSLDAPLSSCSPGRSGCGKKFWLASGPASRILA